MAEVDTRYIRESSYMRAEDLAFNVLRGYEDIPLTGIQGPPGSGKTYIVERIAEGYLAERLFEGQDLVVYVAPTNELAWEACVRVLSRIFRRLAPSKNERCRLARDLQDLVRVLGYKIRSIGVALRDTCEGGVQVRRMVDLTIDENVRLVFTTEFQRPFIRSGRPVKLIVDESSRSPYFRSFIPVVRRIAASGYRDYPVSMVVLGDPQQAIMSEGYGRDILLMNVVKRRLKECACDKNYVMLDRTFRLPKPSERPISFGFYEDQLRAVVEGRDRLGNLVFDSGTVLGMLKRYIDTSKSPLQKVVGLLDEAINNGIPLVVLETPEFEVGDTLDTLRAELGFYVSLALTVWMQGYDINRSLAVTSIYTDLPQWVGLRLERRGLSADRLTVQALIGGERDFIVTMLGKEYRSADDEHSTLYAREPELLNVQLSRHRSLITLIGCVNCLSRFKPRPLSIRDERIAATGKRLNEMVKGGEVLCAKFDKWGVSTSCV